MVKTLTRTGKSHSRRPISRRAPAWCKYSPEEVEAFVIKLAKEGTPPSKIGVVLRDQYGIPLVKPIVGKSIKQIMDDTGVKTNLPEDLNQLIVRTTALQRHLARNRSDSVNKRSLELLVSRVYRLANYYKEKGTLPKDWKFKAEVEAA
ncbi:MAG: small subunit ribosomal protein [Thermoproteota archaeon]|nr:small subunit ribosomal protein [Thermoproteota archaeon]